jgi:hypothetical protein
MEFFATHGRFWLPQRQQRVVNGSLTFDEDGIRLDLGDPLRAPQVRADGIVRGSPEPAAMFIGKREGADMTREKDPAEIVETIAQSIRVSQRGARKVKAHRFKELFGYQVLNAPRREKIELLMAEAGIEVRPALKDAGRDDWLVMSMPVEVPVPETSPDPAPKPEWFAHMASVRTDTEREVEMHFASPLFQEGFGYSEEQEAAGFGIRWARGSTPGHVEADLLYFADDKHDVKAGEPLVLVECKRLIKDEKELLAAGNQAHSYALWVIPAYYVITDGRIVSVWDFQGAVAPDRELLRVSQEELARSFGDLYSRLNPRAAAAARQAKVSRLGSPGENRGH